MKTSLFALLTVAALNCFATSQTKSTSDIINEGEKIAIGNQTLSSEQFKGYFTGKFKVGVAVSAAELNKTVVNGVDVKEFIKTNFNSISAENEMKPDAMLNQSKSKAEGKPVVEFNVGANRILKFCADNGLAVRGHVLVWHSQTPGWFFREGFESNGAVLSDSAMTVRMEQYIKAVFELIADKYPNINLYAYDVVNEAFDDSGNGLRTPGSNAGKGESMWTQIYGNEAFIDSAFTFARKYAPKNCKLYYNDYNEYMGNKHNNIVSLIERLYKKGICDGVGMQSHLSTKYPDYNTYSRALKNFIKIGCDVQVTELDITIEENTTEEDQAKLYSDLFKLYSENAENISSVSIWGTQDGMSWRKAKTPLIFDSRYQPKEAYYAIIENFEYVDINEKEAIVAPTSKLKVYNNSVGIVAEPTIDDAVETYIYRVDGSCVGKYIIIGRTEIALPKGIYIIDRTKVVVM